MKTLPDKSIDLFLCDLPYGCLTKQTYKGVIDKSGSDLGKTYGEKITWDIKIDLEKFWEQVKRLAKNDNTPVIHFCNTRFGAELIASNPKWFRYDLVWNKQIGVGFLCANKQPLRSHELIYVFSKKGAYYKRIDVEGDFPKWSVGKNGSRGGNHADKDLPKTNITGGEGKRCVLSVIACKGPRSNQKGEKKEYNHPTQKPAELYKWLIERYCKEGGTILDPTAGSFTSVFTANELGYKAIGIEMNDEFYEKAFSKI
jgi:site-specific DNA-methyltransferase (adenine-specific)